MLAGGSETPAQAAIWTIVNPLPWLAAFEFAKRSRLISEKALVLAGALAVSLALGAVDGRFTARWARGYSRVALAG